MFKGLLSQIRIAFVFLILFTVISGLLYPVIITALAQCFFPWQANGSIIAQQGKPVGSRLMGQAFSSEHYFWSRPSATTPFPYNGENSNGSNMGPSNPDYLSTVQGRVAFIQRYETPKHQKIPVELVTTSGSGLDPEISINAALFQVPRLVKTTHLSEEILRKLINEQSLDRSLGFLGEPRVNVLSLNMALDNVRRADARTPQS